MEQTEDRYRYPWLRNLFFVVLYVALLIFLWHFPLEGPQLFLRTLMRGFLYLLAGLVILGVTALVVLAILPPVEEDLVSNSEFDPFLDGEMLMLSGCALGVPRLKDSAKTEDVWQALESFQAQTEEPSTLMIDDQNGVLMLAADEPWLADDLLHELSRHLKDAGIKVKRVHS